MPKQHEATSDALVVVSPLNFNGKRYEVDVTFAPPPPDVTEGQEAREAAIKELLKAGVLAYAHTLKEAEKVAADQATLAAENADLRAQLEAALAKLNAPAKDTGAPAKDTGDYAKDASAALGFPPPLVGDAGAAKDAGAKK